MWAESSFNSLRNTALSLIQKGEMAPAATKRKRPRNFSKFLEGNKENLKSCGSRLIWHVIEEYKNGELLKAHVNEILHSIFFLGVIYSDGLTPDEFLSSAMAESLRQEFPEPFNRYNRHLPKRTPFSILLDMMVRKYETEDNIMKELRDLLKKLEFPHPHNKPGNKTQRLYTLESTVICVCFNSDCPSKKYYGASLGCKTDDAKNIMIFSSCINTWHAYVSFAVMSFTQTQVNALHFPEHVKCQAHLRDWQHNTFKEIPPCKNCQNMFNLPGEDTEKKHYPYGNCAETECLSKLLFQDNFIRENTRITNYTQDNMTQLKEQTENNLRNKLASIPSCSSMTNNDDLPVFNPN